MLKKPITTMWKPELLAPAKNLERLKVAIAYGADAVYLGGQKYGLRTRADNFTDYDLEIGVAFAHQHDAKVYVTLNAFLHDADFEGLEKYCQFLESIGVDAVIVSDLGVLRVVRHSNLDIHLSTQASCLNSYAARLWKEMGVKRLIVGRELSIAEAGLIRRSGIDVEMFAHGAMCMAYSGHCTISNFTAGRDSNRGGCIQSCRLPYHLQSKNPRPLIVEEFVSSQEMYTPRHFRDEACSGEIETTDNEQLTTDAGSGKTFMSSRDLWGIEQIEEFFKHQICSLKIEGRMKSSFYVALTCKVYRKLIDAYAAGTFTADLLKVAAAELQSIPHRDYFSGSLETPAGSDSVFKQLSGINTGSQQYLGIVIDSTPQEIILQLVEPLALKDEIEFVPFQGEPIRWQVNQLFSVRGERLESMRQDSIVRIPIDVSRSHDIAKLNVVRAAQVSIVSNAV